MDRDVQPSCDRGSDHRDQVLVWRVTCDNCDVLHIAHRHWPDPGNSHQQISDVHNNLRGR